MSDDAKRLFVKAKERTALTMRRLAEESRVNTDPLMLPILVSEYEELRRKAAALDWLEAHPDWTLWFHRPTQRWQCSPRVGRGGVHSGEFPAAAIEAAMRAEEE